VASLPGSRRSYVAPQRSLRQRLPAISVPIPGGASTLLGGGLALAIVACAFAARGGSQLTRATWTEVAFMLTGGILAAAALVLPRHPRTPAKLRGAWVLVAFAVLAAYTALSVNWSLMPGASWLEANRTLSYLAALVAGLALGRLAPGRWSAVVVGIAASAIVLSAWALLTKVFPAAFAADESYARLRPPFDYWNSVGLAAALGIPPLVWLGSRRSGHAAVNALAWPGLGLVVVSLMLAYSRGALLVAALGIAAWIAVVPLRLRAAVMLGGVVAATVPVVAWAFAANGLTTDNAPMALRVDAGQEFGALLLLLCVALTAAGLAVGFLSAYRPPSEGTRVRASRALIGAIAVVPAVAILMLVNAPGGIDGQISKAYKQATDPAASGPANSPQRLTATSSHRSRYWREAFKVHSQAPLLGSGAGAYGTLRLRYRVDQRTVRHAHGYVPQTLADLGWVGLALSLVLAATWLVAAVSVLGLRRRDQGLPWDAERIGLATLAAVVLVFALHSTIDWTWFVPGNALVALLCAGWVASRSTLRERQGPPEPPAPGGPSRAALTAAALVLLLAVFASWNTLQPLRAAHAQDEALERLDRGALPQAASIAQIARERNPLSVDALFELSAIEQARGRPEEARRALEQAVDLEPANPETWRRMGSQRLHVFNDPQGALNAYQAAFYLDPRNLQSTTDVVIAARYLAAR
jgi:hypothetical protein